MPSITWKFVKKPEAASDVILDMNQSYGGNKVVLNFGRSFDISTPPKKRSFAVNSMTDGGRLSSAAYENRVLEFSVSLQGTLEEKTANLSRLNRELGKAKNLIMYTPRPGVIPPVFFRTFSSDEYTIVNRMEKGAWHVDCKVVAEPCAIGERVQPVVEVLTSNDPGSPSNACRMDFPTIIGDCAAPSFSHIYFNPALSSGDTFYLSSRSHDNQYFNSIRQFVPADFGADTVAASGADFSGGAGAVTNFATSNADLITRVTFNSSQVADVYSIRGRYRVLVRMKSSDTTTKYALRLQDDRFSAQDVWSKMIEWTPFIDNDGSGWTHLDFGVLSHPPYQSPPEFGFSGESPGLGGIDLSLQVQRLSGTGTLSTDYAMILPADESMCIISPTEDPQAHIVLDGPNEMVYGMWESSPFNKAATYWYYLYQGTSLIPWRGGIPELVPGAPNTWYFSRKRGTVSALMTFDVYYWPRWLEVAAP